ncbi:MAG TPA: hypothetical protein VH590_17460 [Ktedonobacterales bacterium]|jgi:hypothetical protein
MKATHHPVQAAALEARMQQVDADWEAVTCSIRADKQHLTCLQARLDNLHLLLSLPLDAPSAEAPAMLAQLAHLEQQIALLRRCIAAQDARRNAIVRQFEQERQVWAALCHMSRERRLRPERVHERAASWLRHALAVFWALLGRSASSDGSIPNDLWLRRHASTGGQ